MVFGTAVPAVVLGAAALVVVFGTAVSLMELVTELMAEFVAELVVELEGELVVELKVLRVAKLGFRAAEPVAFPSHEALIDIRSALFAALAFDLLLSFFKSFSLS